MQWIAAHNLRAHLLAVTSGTFTRVQLNAVVKLSHALAIACVRTRTLPAVMSEAHGLSVSDIALDCIADLFEQDETQRYVQLETFFAGVPLLTCSDEEALMHLRRLVFSKTYNGLFRLFNEADPSLGKVLRNIKIAVQSLGTFEECVEAGEPSIRPVATDPLRHLPVPGREELEGALSAVIRGDESVPMMLSKMAAYLRDQRLHRRTVPLIDVAVVFRSLYAKPALLPPATDEMPSELLQNDVRALVIAVCREMRCVLDRTYVARGKLTGETLDLYMRVIGSGLHATYVECDGSAFSLYEALRQELPHLSPQQYRREHRSRLEYLSRLLHEKVRAHLRKHR
jgi:hypothetical protein